MTTDQAELLVTHQDGVMWLTFNRPKKANALSLPVLTEFNRALKEAATRDDVRAGGHHRRGRTEFFRGGRPVEPARRRRCPPGEAPHRIFRRAHWRSSISASR
jgi:enoyl-CoA hydratase/carnithine racemase